MKKVILKEDFIIPKGTKFVNCDGLKIEYGSGNFEAVVGTSKNGVLSIYIDEETIKDNPQAFEVIK